MRVIGQLSGADDARRFGDYLLTQGIKNEVEPDESGTRYLVWVLDEDQLEEATKKLSEFKAMPAAPEFQNLASAADRIRSREEDERQAYLRKMKNSRSLFSRPGSYGAGTLTLILIVICVIVGLRSGLGSNNASTRVLFISEYVTKSFGFLPEVRAGQVWRLVTPIFLHFGFMHLLFNMLWLFQLGSLIEARQGSLVLGFLVVAIAVCSNVPQYWIKNAAFGGMSGVVYGLAGYVWFRGKYHPASGLHLDEQNRMWLMIWMVVCFLGWVGPVANWVHLFGFLMGAGWGRFSAYLASRNPD